MSTLTPNTNAILLLTAPLMAGRSKSSDEILTPGEYKRLARFLRENQHQPADLLSQDSSELIRSCAAVVEADRLERLLNRGFLLSQALERWQSRAMWVISRADNAYPSRLKKRLGEDAPAVLYGCGSSMALLEAGGLAVVGSRQVNDSLIEETMNIGRQASRFNISLISGGAKGIDQAAMRGALENDGKVIGVMADSLEKAVMNRENRNCILEGTLVLLSPFDPNAGFNVGNAMQRNKVIYMLADAALVMSSDINKGGTWTGAKEQLDKYRKIPIYVWQSGEKSEGLEALQQKGASVWPFPKDKTEFQELFIQSAIPIRNENLPEKKPDEGSIIKIPKSLRYVVKDPGLF